MSSTVSPAESVPIGEDFQTYQRVKHINDQIAKQRQYLPQTQLVGGFSNQLKGFNGNAKNSYKKN